MNAVIIQDYDPAWPQRFEMLRLRIANALGPLGVTIEHVGSTAVPGLAAKPIIDIDVLLAPTADMAAAIRKLELLGYEYQGDLGIPGREAFRQPPENVPHHLYVCPARSTEYGRHIAFRDHLRNHPHDAAEYANLKRGLAARFASDRDAYSRAKTDFVEQILKQAELSTTELFDPSQRTLC